MNEQVGKHGITRNDGVRKVENWRARVEYEDDLGLPKLIHSPPNLLHEYL